MTDMNDIIKAVKAGEPLIIIEGEKLSGEIYRIIITKDIAWAVCVGGIAIAVVSLYATLSSGGTASPVTVPAAFFASTPAVATLGGIEVAKTAVGLAALGGGVGVLNQLRGYRVERISDDKLILHKK